MEIAKHYRGTGGDTVPLMPVVTLPAGQDGGLARSARRTSRESTGAWRRRCPNSRLASYASTGDRTFVSDDGRTTFAVDLPAARPRLVLRREPRAEKAASAALADVTVGGAPVHLTGFDALIEDSAPTTRDRAS